MAFAEDLDQFFDDDDFAVEAVFTRGADTIATCLVIFDVPTEFVEMGEVSVSADRPFCYAKSADVADVKRGDTCTIDSVDYTVTLPKPDGTGVTRIELELY